MANKPMSSMRLTLNDWPQLASGAGLRRIEIYEGALRLTLPRNDGDMYADAQLDDYHVDSVMRWRPPATLSIRARFSHESSNLRGTCGFGFWNDPLGMTVNSRRHAWLPRLRLPQAAWFFFAGHPSNLPWAMGVPGRGWKVATVDVTGWLARILLPFAPVGMILCRWTKLYRLLWPWLQQILCIHEQMLESKMSEWHDYRLEWHVDGMRGWIDERMVFQSRHAPRGPLGLVIWIDNQYMVATPQGEIRHGLVACGEQWLEIAELEVVAG